MKERGTLKTIDFYCGFVCISYKYKTNFAARATGFIRVPRTVGGRAQQISLTASGKARIFINNKEVTTLRISGTWQRCTAMHLGPWPEYMLLPWLAV